MTHHRASATGQAGSPAAPTATTPATAEASGVRVVGFPKTGLHIELYEEPSRLAMRGSADPLLLYFVFGTALAVGIGGSVLVSPSYGFLAVILFSVLFSPLLVFSALGWVRLRSDALIDRANQRVRVTEQSFVGQWEREWPLDRLRAVEIVARPPARWSSGGPGFELRLNFGQERYLARLGPSESSLRRDATRIGRFVGVPLAVLRAGDEGGAASVRDLALASTLFVLPVVVSVGLIGYLLGAAPAPAGLSLASMSALLVCQVGGILAYTYYRSRQGGD